MSWYYENNHNLEGAKLSLHKTKRFTIRKSFLFLEEKERKKMIEVNDDIILRWERGWYYNRSIIISLIG